MSEPEFLLLLTERNVIEQLKNLRTHPAVSARLKHGDLRLHGWVYHIGNGAVTVYNPDKNRFVRIRASKSRKTKIRSVLKSLGEQKKGKQ